MISAKWYYVNSGACLEGAAICAMQGNLGFTILCFGFALATYMIAEAKAAKEKTNV